MFFKVLYMVVIILLVVAIYYYINPCVEVIGESMSPTYEDGEELRATRLFKMCEGEVYVYRREGKYVIKRLDHLIENSFGDKKTYCFFLGDNPKNSLDSRYYGYVDSKFVVAKITD